MSKIEHDAPTPTAEAHPTRLGHLSVAIVCKDNISTIWRTIESVRDLAGEIVAIDSGSTDGTIELLERCGVRVVRSAWLGHIKTKQKALEACSRDWVLCLDSDESPDRAMVEAIRITLAQPKNIDAGVDGFEMNRKTYYQGRALEHVWQPEWRLRLVRKGAAAWGGLDPHDVLALKAHPLGASSRTRRLDGHLRHDSFPTFAEHMRKQWAHATTMAKSLHAAGVRPSYLRLVVSPAGAFVKQLIVKGGWRDGYPGWLAAASAAVNAMIKHATLIELAHNS